MADFAGHILWNKNGLGTIEISNNDGFEISNAMADLEVKIETHTVSFIRIKKSRTACYQDERPFTVCDQCYTDFTYFVEEVVVVIEQTGFLGEVSDNYTYLEKRMMQYNIK